MTDNDGGPAFPHPSGPHPSGWRRKPEISDGMSLRDWFAGQMLAGFHASCGDLPWPSLEGHCEIARQAYMAADAMLAARQGWES